MLLLHLLSDPIQTWYKHLSQILLLTEEVGFELIYGSLVLMTSLDKYSLIFQLSLKNFAFLTQIMKTMLWLKYLPKGKEFVALNR